jgi:hypothetical protein
VEYGGGVSERQHFCQRLQRHSTAPMGRAAVPCVHEMARILHIFVSFGLGWNIHPVAGFGYVMNAENRFFSMIVGGIVVVAIAIFIFSGGELGGKKTIEGDDDLPPVVNTDK